VQIPPWERSGPVRLFAGIDLGATGAICVVDANRRRIECVLSTPTVLRKINNKERRRLDYEAFGAMLEMFNDLGVEQWTVEKPGAGFGAGGRELGELIGAFTMKAHDLQLSVEWVTPGRWKRFLQCPADKREACLRAEQLFPHDRDKLKGSKGGRSDGKAEAAMVALFGIMQANGGK